MAGQNEIAMARLKSFLVNLALMLGGLALMLLAGEGIVRLIRPPQVSYTRAPCFYIPDDQVGYRFQPSASGLMFKNFEINQIDRINMLGFHDVEHRLPPAGDGFRVMALGDSFTAALEVDVADGWTQTAQRKLRALGHPNAEVLNLGIDGIGPNIELKLLKRFAPIFRPDAVVVAFYKNDPLDISEKLKHRECYKNYTVAYQTEAERQAIRAFIDGARPVGSTFQWWLDRSYLFRLFMFPFRNMYWKFNYLNPVRNYYAPAMLDIKTDKRAENPPTMDEIFAEMQSLAQTYNFRLLVIPVPANNSWNHPTDSMDALKTSLSPDMLWQLDVVDVLPEMQSVVQADGRQYADLFFKYDEHFSKYGQHVYGTIVAERVHQYAVAAPIELRVQPPRAGLWTEVQWVDGAGGWHAVENWRTETNGGGSVTHWVEAKDFGTGPFRFAVYDVPGGTLLGASDPFMLPRKNQTARVTVVVNE